MVPFKDFNFFIGANNSGKSTVIDFIDGYVGLPAKRKSPHALERHTGAVTGDTLVALPVSTEEFKTRAIANVRRKDQVHGFVSVIGQLVDKLSNDEFVWLTSKLPLGASGWGFLKSVDQNAWREMLPPHSWRDVWTVCTGSTGGGIDEHWIPETVRYLSGLYTPTRPKVSLIPAKRQIGPKAEQFVDFSGKGLIDRLAEIQNPDHDKRHERAVFQRINAFLQVVTGRPNAEIEIPYNRDHILVHMDNKVLPLSSLGTGIHEVILIAAFCTLSAGQVVCIEEPELHLHPLLQRKLVDYLKQNTDNQYFIATHSAAFIDTPGAAIFHVHNDGAQTTIRESLLRRERFAICRDLGMRASDLVQANCVIWVEGPSDRLYVNHWIRAADTELHEGIHYSIMFYGGRLLSHLSADDAEVTEFIELRSLNRHLAVIMDSDKKSPQAQVNATKARIIAEFEGGPGLAWLTKGREIENYLPYDVLQAAVKSLYPAYLEPHLNGRYEHALYFKRSPKTLRDLADDIERDVDKVKVAKLVCQQPANLEVLDLRERIAALVELIRDANT